jgi:hypothetical protein
MLDSPRRPTPPKQTGRKASPVNAEFEDRAKRLLRDAIGKRGVTIEELAQRLDAIGVHMSPGGVANKISRGGFSAAFLLQCAEALDVDIKACPKTA